MLQDASGRSLVYEAFQKVRRQTKTLCEPLEIEDYVVQAMPEASPPKWHLAHTTWFFETFVLGPFHRNYQVFHPSYPHLFNSYYEQVGQRHPRHQRGLLSRPTVEEIYRYRDHVDLAMMQLLERETGKDVLERAVLGIHHEQQHQELILTDLKCMLGKNPLLPTYRATGIPIDSTLQALEFLSFRGGLVSIGADQQWLDFHFDNESPRHQVLLPDFALANRLVTNSEYLDFVRDGGYKNPVLWLSDGWAECQSLSWTAPEHWFEDFGTWKEFTLHGPRDLDPTAPVTHVSFYEADAYARWHGARLPTEFEWEYAAEVSSSYPSLVGIGKSVLHPQSCEEKGPLHQLFGQCWQWTASAYTPYPGFRPVNGALGEYNGKFMANQIVLRGSSCVTPPGHARLTYRNFFYPRDRWQFSGIRLAKDLD